MNYYSLISGCIPKNKRWMAEVDYVDQLSEDEKRWLNQFQREFVEGRVKKGDPNALHSTDELRKACYNQNNKINNDVLAIKNCNGKLSVDLDRVHISSFEKKVIDTIDSRSTCESIFFLLECIGMDDKKKFKVTSVSTIRR